MECGHRLDESVQTEKLARETEGERKHVTVLFSDLSGYTAMSEKLDPEEVKEIMSRIFGEIAQVVAKYEGFVEKFFADAVMALFGVPKAREDDPVRGPSGQPKGYTLWLRGGVPRWKRRSVILCRRIVALIPASW
jgi:class 3 adenylate cyclase